MSHSAQRKTILLECEAARLPVTRQYLLARSHVIGWNATALACGLSSRVNFRVSARLISQAPRKHRNFAMIPRLRGAVQRGITLQTQHTSRSQIFDAAANSRYLLQRAARIRNTSGWAPLSPSRVVSSLSRRRLSGSQAVGRIPSRYFSQSFYAAHLKSAFPTKTVIFFLVLGGLAYYFVDVEEADWTDDVLLSYQDDQSHTTPLHFNGNKEELDHYLQVSFVIAMPEAICTSTCEIPRSGQHR
jgi:hypothetical protein